MSQVNLLRVIFYSFAIGILMQKHLVLADEKSGVWELENIKKALGPPPNHRWHPQYQNQVADIKTLKLVQVLFRHGDRAPTNSYPTDPLNGNSSTWPEGIAQLTSIGKMQQYNLGQYIRKRYDGFLASKYLPDELYVMSSDMDRTIMSLESNLAGLFPPVHKWHPYLDWQPIPLRTIPWKEDRYLHVNTRCPKYDKIHRDFVQNSEVAHKLNEENRDFVQYLSEKSGVRATTVKEIIMLQDIILTEFIHDLPIPQWALDALPRLNELHSEVNTWSTFTDEMKRLRGGPLLDLLIKNMMAKSGHLRNFISDEEKHRVVGGGNRKMLMYSAHDSTLVRLMNTMGIFHRHNPPYASALMLELHWDYMQQFYFIKIFYRNDTRQAPHELKIPNCDNPCSLTQLIDLTRHLIPHDLDAECQNEENRHLRTSGDGNGNDQNNCMHYAYPDPIFVGIIASVIFVSSLLSWFCLAKLIQCCGSSGKSSPSIPGSPGRAYYERL